MKNKEINNEQILSSVIDFDNLTNELESWLNTHTKLPSLIEKSLLKRFLYAVHGDVSAAKKLIELNYTLRNKHVHIFLNRDPYDVNAQQLLQTADLVPLPGLTSEKHKLLLYRLIDYDADKFNFVEGIKVFFMIADCRFAIEDDNGELSEGEIPIFDMAGYTLRHLTKTVFSALRIYMKFVQEAHPVRLHAIHVLNCPSYLDKVLTVVRPLIKSDVFKLIQFHVPNAETPYKFIPRDMMPEEYGGKAGKMSDLKAQWINILNDKRAYLMDINRWKIQKLKKSTITNISNNNMEILRNLEID